MIDKIVNKVIGPLVGGISGYFNLPVYGRAKYNEIRGRILTYNSENEFWKDAIGPYFYNPAPTNLFDGQLVKLDNFEITEWFPRCPGLIWTKDGNKYRNQATKFLDRGLTDQYIVYSPRGKTFMVLGGRGTTRLESHLGDYDYKVLCATSSGRCDAGIPLVVSRDVYEEIRNELQHEGSVCADLKGFYSQLPLHYDQLVLESPGSELPMRLRSWLANSLYIPRYCLKVESRLLIRKKESVSNIQATAWTLFRFEDPELPYSFVFWSFDPRNEDSILSATRKIQIYIENYGAGEILTDFDERVQRFVSKFPLSSVMDPRMDTITEQKTIFEDIFRGAKELDDVDDYI